MWIVENSISPGSVMRRCMIAIVGMLAACLTMPAISQQFGNSTVTSPATITFTLDFPQSNPEHYSISVDAAGHASYECTGKVTEDSEVESYHAAFDVTSGDREKIFDWAKQAQYFSGKLDSGNGKLAFTGAKTLTYRDGQRSNSAGYNYSNLAPVRELTSLFQDIETTLEYGRRLSYYHRYQKLALDEELKRMEAQAKHKELSELQSVVPVLQEIADDPSVIHVVRARAKQLMDMSTGAVAVARH